MAPPPNLPPLLELAGLLASRLAADGVTPLSAGPYPSAALRFGEHHPVLVRTFHGGDARLSLPKGTYVDLRLQHQIDADLRPLRDALSSLLAEPVLGLCDLVVALLDSALGLQPCTIDWPGVTVPEEAWLGRDDVRIGLFHRPGPLRVVVWAGSELIELELPDRAAFAGLATWLPPALERQRAADAAAAAELARLTALPVPTLAEVWQHLRDGHDLSMGVGRWGQRYWLRDGVLWCTTHDEGDVEEGRVEDPDRALQAAIDFDAIAVRRVLEAVQD